MVSPRFAKENITPNWLGFHSTVEVESAKTSDIFIPTEPITEISEGFYGGFVVGKDTVEWEVFPAKARIRTDSISVSVFKVHLTDIAYPIDPRMTRKDIEGATIAYANPDNTGWLFAHATREEHHDREVLTEAVLSAVFADEISDLQIQVIQLIVNQKSTSRQRGELTNYDALAQFRQDVMEYARARERTLHIGQHIQEPLEYPIHKMALKAIEGVKQIWQASKESTLASIAGPVGRIQNRLQQRHGYQTRWAIAAARKKATASNDASE